MGPRSRRRLALAAAVLGLAGLAPAAHADITAQEGTAFSGDVADLGGCTTPIATIDWGDGTMSAGTLTGSTVSGMHTYAEARVYQANVTYRCSNFSGVHTIAFQATVQDVPLAATGRDGSGTATEPLSALVAHFTDANTLATAADFTAQITWGDGSTTAGTVGAAAGGGFDVTGTHTYAASGSYPVSTAILDVGGSTAHATSQILVAAPPPPPPPPGPPATPRPRRPTASFTVSPAVPCGDQETDFDASASRGGAYRIVYYDWSIDDVPASRFTQGRHRTGAPAYTYFFTSTAKVGAFRGQRTHTPSATGGGFFGSPSPVPLLYNVYEYSLSRGPATVTLTVTNEKDQTASVTKTLTFANPVVHELVGYEANNSWAIPGFAQPTWIVTPAQRGPCDLSYARLFGTSANKASSLAAIFGSHVVVTAHRRLTLESRCAARRSCLAMVAVLPQKTAYRAGGHVSRAKIRRALGAALGSRTFVVPAGKTISVAVPLNSRGRALARRHPHGKVTLLLGAVGAKGKIVLRTKVVRLTTARR